MIDSQESNAASVIPFEGYREAPLDSVKFIVIVNTVTIYFEHLLIAEIQSIQKQKSSMFK